MHWLPCSTQSVCRRAQPCLPTELRYFAVSVSACWALNTASQEYVADTINYMSCHVLFFYRQCDWERTTDLREMFGVLKNHLSFFHQVTTRECCSCGTKELHYRCLISLGCMWRRQSPFWSPSSDSSPPSFSPQVLPVSRDASYCRPHPLPAGSKGDLQKLGAPVV